MSEKRVYFTSLNASRNLCQTRQAASLCLPSGTDWPASATASAKTSPPKNLQRAKKTCSNTAPTLFDSLYIGAEKFQFHEPFSLSMSGILWKNCNFVFGNYHLKTRFMKKTITFLLAFFIVWAFSAFMCYLLNLILGRSCFTNGWQEYVIIGFAVAMAGTFGPILSAWISKCFKKKSWLLEVV